MNFSAGGIDTPADAALRVQLGADSVFAGPGIFKSEKPSVNNYPGAEIIAKAGRNPGKAMPGLDVHLLMPEEVLQVRGNEEQGSSARAGNITCIGHYSSLPCGLSAYRSLYAADTISGPEVRTMKITDVSAVVPGPNPHHVDARKVYESPHAEAVVITLQPREALKKHITPVDVFFYVLEGTGVVEIGDGKETVGKDTLVESPARIPHVWSNQSGSVFRVLVVKVPKPVERTTLL